MSIFGKIRNQKGKVLKFKNFIELGYLNMNRSDYGPNEVAEYRKQIVKYIVPLVKKVKNMNIRTKNSNI